MIYESEELSILKGFKIKFIEASPNPMNMRSRDKYFQMHSYFIRKDEKIRPVVLKKNRILKLLDNEKVDQINTYSKINQLSFSREADIRRILKYYNSL
jgi:hypothetical protein